MPERRHLLRRMLLGLIVLPLLIALAWLASNVVDNAEKPLPPALALGPSGAGSPLFYSIQGLLAAPGADPQETGRREWQQVNSDSRTVRDTMERKKPFQAPPLDCRPPQDCAQLLLSSLPQLSAQLAPTAWLGERCVAALADDKRFEEQLPSRMNAASPLPNYMPGLQCGLWFSGQAVLAASRSDRNTSLLRLRQGSQLADAMLTGCRMLICKMVAVRLMESQLDSISAVAALRPAWVAELSALLKPLPPQALSASEWLKVEHAQMRGGLAGIMGECGPGMAALLFDSASPLLDKALDFACRHHIGLLPNATGQAMEQRWLGMATAAGQGIDPALDWAINQRRAGQATAAESLAWRNTVGRKLAGTLNGAMYDEYFARQADLELRRVAVLTALAAQVQRVPPAGRATWLSQQSMAERQRSRMAWVDGGTSLQVTPWLAELNPRATRAATYRVAAGS